MVEFFLVEFSNCKLFYVRAFVEISAHSGNRIVRTQKMASQSTSEIDSMVRTVERIIAQNDAVLSQYDDEYTPASEVSANSDPNKPDLESTDLF